MRILDERREALVEREREAIAPYTRFVRSEHARMTSAGEDLAALDAETRALKDEISAPGVGPKTSLKTSPRATAPGIRCRLGRRVPKSGKVDLGQTIEQIVLDVVLFYPPVPA